MVLTLLITKKLKDGNFFQISLEEMSSNTFFFLDIFTQGKGEEGFELVNSASLGVVYSQLSYHLETLLTHLK
jgi:hypothetical protein